MPSPAKKATSATVMDSVVNDSSQTEYSFTFKALSSFPTKPNAAEDRPLLSFYAHLTQQTKDVSNWHAL